VYITEIVRAEDFEQNRRGPFHKYARRWHGLILYTGEAAQMIVDGQTYHYGYGDLLFLPRSLAYRMDQLEGTTKCLVIDFFGEDVGGWFLVHDCADLRERFAECVRLWEARAEESARLDCMAAVYALFAEAYRRRGTSAACEAAISRRRIEQVLEYVHANFTAHDLRVSSLAAMAGVSTRYLGRLFTEAVGMPPKAYIEELRIKYADDLLSDRKFTVAETAKLAGYTDPYHFSKIYKARRGIPPSGRAAERREKKG